MRTKRKAVRGEERRGMFDCSVQEFYKTIYVTKSEKKREGRRETERESADLLVNDRI